MQQVLCLCASPADGVALYLRWADDETVRSKLRAAARIVEDSSLGTAHLHLQPAVSPLQLLLHHCYCTERSCFVNPEI